MLMRNERLARLKTRFDAATHGLAIELEGSIVAAGDLRTSAGRSSIENFFAQFCADELRGPPRVLHANDHSFSDVARKVISIINLASVAEVESAVGAPVDPLRFRGNLYVAGWPAWHEFSLLGREIRIGSARARIVKRIQRCAATEVDPATALRDLPIPRTLLQSFGHGDCGVYAEVIADGEIKVGDAISDDGRRTDDAGKIAGV
jgi:MOSC domain-containing protein